MNMTDNIRKLISENPEEAQVIVNGYKEIEVEVIGKLNEVSDTLSNKNLNISKELTYEKIGPFNWRVGSRVTRVYKCSITKGVNEIWIQLHQDGIKLYSSYYFVKERSLNLENKAKSSLNDYKVVDYKQTADEIVEVFQKQLEIATKIFQDL